ncbi:MAG: hypothetical protein QXU99_01890 [Candidatus Bathyarchaeia archaeon]
MVTITNKVAEALYQSGCIKFGNFKIKSGALSPYYIDLAGLLSSPHAFCEIVEIAADIVKQVMGFDRITKLASIELKGALIIPSIACKVGIPCLVVRKENKAYGVTGRLAGAPLNSDDCVLFFDDVLSEGSSKLEGLKFIEASGAIVRHILVVVDREQGGKESLEKLGYNVHALAKISELTRVLFNYGWILKDQADAVLTYVNKKLV